MKWVKRIIKWLLVFIIILVILLGVGTYLLNTPKVQNWLLQQTTSALSDKLETRVVADSISVNLFRLQMSLYGLSVDDRQGRELFGVSELDGSISLKSLGAMEIIINSIETDSLRATLVKERPDSAYNFQFVIDALKKEKDEEDKDTAKGQKVRIDFRHICLNSTDINYHDSIVDAHGRLPLLDFTHDGERFAVTIDRLSLKTKGNVSVGSASPGGIDLMNIDLLASVKCKAHLMESDSISSIIDNISIREKHSGIDIHDLKLEFEGSQHCAHLKDFTIQQGKAKISLDKADIELPSNQKWDTASNIKASVKKLNITDDKGRQLATLKSLDGSVRIKESEAKKTINIDNIDIDGLKATIAKDASGKSNYDFITNLAKRFSMKGTPLPTTASSSATTKETPKKVSVDKPKSTAATSAPPKAKPTINLGKVRLKDIQLSMSMAGKSTDVSLSSIDVNLKNGTYDATVNGLKLKTDNHKPRKNTGKPKRGWFDAGHLDVSTSMKIRATVSKDGSINGHLTDGTLKDPTSGIDISGLTADAVYSGNTVKVSNLSFKQKSTSLNIGQANITLPNRQAGSGLSYNVGSISGNVVLADISRPFAPVLQNFKMPLKLQAKMSGTAKAMEFTGVSVSTNDQRLTVSANGQITHLGEKGQTAVNFNVSRMHAKESVIEPVISQFPVKKLMMSELHRLGDITYTGRFGVVFKRVDFNGNLTTNVGTLGVGLTIDSKDHWLIGNVSSNAILVGKIFELKNLGDVKAKTTFKIDISKERTAKMRQQKGGKLPIGSANIRVDDCSYSGVHLRNLVVEVESDGGMARGRVINEGKRMDVSCEFTFTNTEHLGSSIKVTKPKLEFHKKQKDPDAEKGKELKKQEKAEAKAQKKQEKAEAKAQKAEEKAAAKALKEQEKKEKSEAKAKKKQEKAEAKAQKEKEKSDESESGTGEDSKAKKKKKKVFGIF